jgi:hypothetical protein
MYKRYIWCIQPYLTEPDAMPIDVRPTAAASYARSLISRGCPAPLAAQAGQILARTDNVLDYTAEEKAVIERAYSSLRR